MNGASGLGDGNNWIVAMVLAILALLLVPVNAWLATQAQYQAQILGQRRNYIQQTPQLARIVEVTATELARASLQPNGDALKALLVRNGITVTPNPAPGTPSPAAPSPAAPSTSPSTPSTVRP